VSAARRLSPRVITELLDVAAPAVAALFEAQAPHEPALFPVAWAGELASERWMDVGREYTEWWHHQMQIRDAVGAPLLLSPRWFRPLLDLSARVLPRAYSAVPAGEGTAVTLEVKGEAGGVFTLVREDEVWRLFEGEPEGVRTRLSMDADTAWRLLYNALPQDAACARATLAGDQALAAPLLAARSVMV
jgi:hypothetical protein